MKQSDKPVSRRRRAWRKAAAIDELGKPPAVKLDELDERIIAEMRKDGRISNRELAGALGVNEATVRTRLRRLEETNTIRVVAIRDLAAMGHEYVAAVGVQIKGRSVTDVAADLATIDKVFTVNVTIGAHDLEIQVVASNIEEMGHLLTHILANVKGVARLSPSLALRVLKYETQWAPLS